MPTVAEAQFVMGISLKMYFGARATLEWCARIRDIALRHQAVVAGSVDIFVLPSFPVLTSVVSLFEATPIGVGAQDLFWEDRGPFTGEVSGSMLAELGCRYVEIGHAERRSLFGETDGTVALKVEAALRNQLSPIVCVGETDREDIDTAAQRCVVQLNAALKAADGVAGDIICAYEPVWAIGASDPAPPEHIEYVCRALRTAADSLRPLTRSRILYGGSAGPGLIGKLGGSVDGLFLGRSAHDPNVLESILDELSVP